jgi:hypothetical protein
MYARGGGGGLRGRDNCTAECPGRSTVLEGDLPTIVVCREYNDKNQSDPHHAEYHGAP